MFEIGNLVKFKINNNIGFVVEVDKIIGRIKIHFFLSNDKDYKPVRVFYNCLNDEFDLIEKI